MGALLYFLPEVKGGVSALATASNGRLVSYGLADMLGENVSTRGADAGPSGTHGLVVSHSGRATQIGYWPDRQTWSEVPACEGRLAAWIGFATDSPPGPDDLARDEQVGGHMIKLGDGREWLIPIARAFPDDSPIDEILRIGPNGELVKAPLPKYAAITADADRVWRMMESANDDPNQIPSEDAIIPDLDCIAIATRALAINYRVRTQEVSALDLILRSTVMPVLLALIDYPTRMSVVKDMVAADAKKKGAADTSGGSDS